MLSVLYMESADALAHLVRFYCPKAPRLLDVTHGTGTMTKKCPVPVLGVDLDPTSKAKVLANSTALPFAPGSFEAALFDPPYLYGSQAMHMGPIGKKTWQSQRTTWKRPEELEQFAAGVAAQLADVLTPHPIVLVKIMNSRYKTTLVRNDDLVTRCFTDEGFRLHDQLIYVRTVTGSFPNPSSSQMAHGFYLVFKR
jgi:hypothetical protein